MINGNKVDHILNSNNSNDIFSNDIFGYLLLFYFSCLIYFFLN